MTTPTEETQDRGQWTSASNAAADLLCAGRHLAQRGLPDIKSEDAETGTKIHAALAKQDPAGLTLEETETYDACNEIEARLLIKYFGPEVANLKPNPVRERRFWIKWADGLMHSGQIDSAHRKGVKALIVEYKTLQGNQPSAPSNQQLRDQVCLFDWNTPMLQEVATAVIQPLVTWDAELCVYTREHILRAREEMYARVNASNQPDAKRVPGEALCKYCRAKGTCKEYQLFAGRMVIVDDQMVAALNENPVAMWSPQMRAMFLDRLPVAQKWLEECKDELKKLLKEHPDAIPGWGFAPGKNRTKYLNPQAIFDVFATKGGTIEQFMACLNVGNTKFKEAVAEVTKLKGKKLDDEIKAIVGENVEVAQDEPSLKKNKG